MKHPTPTHPAMKRALQGALLFVILSFGFTSLAQEPPKEAGTFRQPDLVELVGARPAEGGDMLFRHHGIMKRIVLVAELND